MAAFINLLKSLFYQGNWNTANMQGTGFAWLARPRIKQKGVELSEDDNNSLNAYFNTNPSFVNLVVSIVVKESAKKNYAKSAKDIYGPAMAAIGDSFFWHALRPLLFLAALLACMKWDYIAAALYPAVYAVFHILFLLGGGFIGGIMGLQSITFFDRIRFKWWTNIADNISTFILGAVIAYIIKDHNDDNSLYTLSALAAFAAGYIVYIKLPRTLAVRLTTLTATVLLLTIGGITLWKTL